MKPGRVVWITGISAAGKTTVAAAASAKLRQLGRCLIHLDGDDVRQVVSDPHCGHCREDRIVNAYRISRMAKMLAGQGLDVLVSTMSLYHEIHDWNRANIPEYFEVYLKVDVAVAASRDPKGIYRKIEQGLEKNLCGKDIEFEEPRQPDLVIENGNRRDDVGPVAQIILKRSGLLAS